MTCPRCRSQYVNIQAVTTVKNRKHGWAYWLLFGWLFDLLIWIFAFIPRLFVAIFRRGKVVSITHSEAVCQNCGYRWKV